MSTKSFKRFFQLFFKELRCLINRSSDKLIDIKTLHSSIAVVPLIINQQTYIDNRLEMDSSQAKRDLTGLQSSHFVSFLFCSLGILKLFAIKENLLYSFQYIRKNILMYRGSSLLPILLYLSTKIHNTRSHVLLVMTPIFRVLYRSCNFFRRNTSTFTTEHNYQSYAIMQ